MSSPTTEYTNEKDLSSNLILSVIRQLKRSAFNNRHLIPISAIKTSLQRFPHINIDAELKYLKDNKAIVIVKDKIMLVK